MSIPSQSASTSFYWSNSTDNADIVVLLTVGNTPKRDAAAWLADNDADGRVTNVLNTIGIKGTRLELVGTQRVLLVDTVDSMPSQAQLRSSLTQAAKVLNSTANAASAAIIVEGFEGWHIADVARVTTEALLSGMYSYNVRDDATPRELAIKRITLVTQTDEALQAEIEEQATIGTQQALACNFQRKLIDTPPNLLGVDRLVNAASKVAEAFSASVDISVLRGEDLAKFGLLNAVARASDESQRPAVVVLSYKGDPGNPAHTVLVGKGLVFDTGGINLKSDGGRGMKADMGGAAVALSAFYAIAATSTPANVSVVLGIVRNDIGPNAYAPDDVYTAYNGKTVEIGNTDAEGRLVLADCLAYAEENLKPTRIISIATLTGAKLVAVGEEYAAALSLNQEFADTFLRVARNSDELAWQLPLSDAVHGSSLNSKVADLVNIGAGRAGTCTAAYFLTRFVDKVPYLHLDVAGTVGPGKEAWGVRTLRALVNP